MFIERQLPCPTKDHIHHLPLQARKCETDERIFGYLPDEQTKIVSLSIQQETITMTGQKTCSFSK